MRSYTHHLRISIAIALVALLGMEGSGMMIGNTGAFLAGKLPYDAEVEYLESTGSQWIDTGLNYFADFEVGIKIRTSVPNKALGIGSFECLERHNASDPCWQLNINSREYHSRASIVDYHIMSWKGGVFAADGVVVDTVSNPFVSGTMTLFGVGGKTFPNMIYACKLWDAQGNLVRDLIPVRFTNENGQSEGAMYDRANPTVGMNPDGSARTDGLYRNRGTGAFTWAEKT